MRTVRTQPRGRGFTLVEVLVAMSILSLLLVMMLKTTSLTSRAWQDTTEKMKAFSDARAAFDQITGKLSQSVMNTYWDYDDVKAPTYYKRQSELQFLSLPMASLTSGVYPAATYPTHAVFFQAPTGMVYDKGSYGNLPNLLNAYGYFIQYGDDDSERPDFLDEVLNKVPKKFTFRLKEWTVPSEKLTLYSNTSGSDYLGTASMGWIDLQSPTAHTLAENVIALIVLPKKQSDTSSGKSEVLVNSKFIYNSRNDVTTGGSVERMQKHQLPPEVDVVMVAIDEGSARSLRMTTTPPQLVDPAWFQDPEKLDDSVDGDGDLTKLQKSLDQKRIRYILLRSTVMLRAGRWSESN